MSGPQPQRLELLRTCLCLLATLAGCHSFSGSLADERCPSICTADEKKSARKEPDGIEFQGVSESRLMNAAGKWGSVTGQVLWTSPSPARRLLYRKGDSSKDAEVCCRQGLPDERLLVDPRTRGIANCFVFLKRKPNVLHPLLKQPGKSSVTQRIQGCRFVPRCLTIRSGQTVRYQNTDRIRHFPHVSTGRPLPAGLATPIDRMEVHADRAAEVPWRITCDFHSWMGAWWLVTDHPYAAVTSQQGEFRISGLPVGTHEFTVWHERAGYLRRTLKVTVLPGEVVRMEGLKFGKADFEDESDKPDRR